MQDLPPRSALGEPAWRRLRQLDSGGDEPVLSLAACLAAAEQRFVTLFGQVLPRFAESESDLTAEADVLADAHHALTLLQDSLHVSSQRMLDVLDRISRELGE